MATAQVKVRLDSEARTEAIDSMRRKMKVLDDQVASLRATLGGLAGAAGGAGLALGFSAATARLDTLTESIVRAEGRVNISGESYQVFGKILKDAGGNAEDLTSSLVILMNQIGTAMAEPSSPAAKAIKEIHLRATELSRLKPDEILERVARALSGVEDPARRSAIAQDLLGRGAANIRPVLDRLATEGFGAMRAEVAATAGILSNDLTYALDNAGDRADAAQNRIAIALSGMALKAKETRASFTELFADAAEMPMSGAAFTSAVGLGGASYLGGYLATAGISGLAGAGKASLNGLNAALIALPAWKAAGALIGVGAVGVIVGALAIKGIRDAAIAEGELRDEFLKAPLERAQKLRDLMRETTDPAVMSRIEYEASRRARLTFQQAQETTDPEQRANLEQASRQYALLVAHVREHGAAMIEANRLLADQNAAAAEAEKIAAAREVKEAEAAEWLKKQGKNIAEQTAERRRKLDLDAMDPADRLAALEKERAAAVDAQGKFAGTASEVERNRLETESKLVAIDQEIAATKKAITAEAEKSANAAKREADEAERKLEAEQKAAKAAYDRAVDRRLADLHAQDSANQANFRLTAEEKRSLRRDNLAEQQQLMTNASDVMRNAGDLESAHRYSDRSIDLGGQIAADEAGTPTTAMDGIEAGLTSLQDRWGTLAQQMRTGVEEIGSGITSGIGGALNQVLGTTEFWTQKLGFAGNIIGSLTSGISRMFAEWIVGLGAKFLKEMLFAKTSAAAGAAIQLGTAAAITPALSAMWAVPATLATIATLGAAAVQAPPSILAAQGIVLATSVAGFFEGGFTGLGDPNDPAGIVHRGEFVIPHDVTSAVGPGALSGLVDSIRNPSPSFSAPEALFPTAPDYTAAVGSRGENGGGVDMKALADHITMIVVPPGDYAEARRIARHSAARGDIVRIVEEDFGLPRKA